MNDSNPKIYLLVYYLIPLNFGARFYTMTIQNEKTSESEKSFDYHLQIQIIIEPCLYFVFHYFYYYYF